MADKEPQTWTFKVENETYHSPTQIITGADVRTAGPGIPATMDIYLKEKGKPGCLIKDTDKIDLNEKGVEKFYSQEASSEAGNH
jgi:hypothetical protein